MNHMTDLYDGTEPWNDFSQDEEEPTTAICFECGLEASMSEAMYFIDKRDKKQLLCPDCVLELKKEGYTDNNFKTVL